MEYLDPIRLEWISLDEALSRAAEDVVEDPSVFEQWHPDVQESFPKEGAPSSRFADLV